MFVQLLLTCWRTSRKYLARINVARRATIYYGRFMYLTPIERLLKNLKGEIPSSMRREYLSKEVAYEKLKVMTGIDLGLDIEKWEHWIQEQQAAGIEFRIP